MTVLIEPDKAQPATPPESDLHAKKAGSRSNYHSGSNGDKLFYAGIVTDSLNRNPQTRQLMFPFGYNDDKIFRFTKAYENASVEFAKQQIEYAQKSAAFENFENALTRARQDLSSLIRVAKVALKNDTNKFKSLDLSGDKGKITKDTFFYMEKFYNAIFMDSNIISLLANYGYNESKVNACNDSFLKAKTAYADFCKENSEAVEATAIRDAKMAELNEWMYDYYALAKVAYLQKNEFVAQPQNNQ